MKQAKEDFQMKSTKAKEDFQARSTRWTTGVTQGVLAGLLVRGPTNPPSHSARAALASVQSHSTEGMLEHLYRSALTLRPGGTRPSSGGPRQGWSCHRAESCPWLRWQRPWCWRCTCHLREQQQG
eukprot:1151985-Pelagomonas_calceolata.AAC.9